MLSVALLLSAGMGIIQEKLYKKYGKHPDEALYYNVIYEFKKIYYFY
jgi:solute carrier family 35 (UDP-xylose/UDP-N-acetylglucosamine transporter), member B4